MTRRDGSCSDAGPDRSGRPHVVVVGGGLSGAVFAIHLLRDHGGRAFRLTLIEPRARLGAGLAYSATDPQHRTNVAASRMALFAEDKLHFERWLIARDDAAADPASRLPDGRFYPRRHVFGAYLAETLQSSVEHAGDRVLFRHLRDLATDARREDGRVIIGTEGGEHLVADTLVLALGHPPPSCPAFLRDVPDAHLVADPWRPDALGRVAPDDRVAIIGTGLTSADVIASLAARNHRGPIAAISRHGLLPRPRTTKPVTASGNFADRPSTSALELLRRVRREVALCRQADRPWEDVIDALRRDAPVQWPALPVREKRRLLRHLKAFWDVHRFQCAPQIDAIVSKLLARGQLTVQRGRIRRITAEADLSIELVARNASPGAMRCIKADIVVNCTGPGHRGIFENNALARALASDGVLQPDALGLGFEVDADSRPIGIQGETIDNVFIAGPLARSAHGELMGLPQVSNQPRTIAAAVARRLGQASAEPPSTSKRTP